MTTFQELVDEYGRDGDIETMEHLTRKVNYFVEKVREKHPDMAEYFLIDVDLLLNPHFTKETAKKAVSEIKNKDGSYGEHWSHDITTKVMESKGYDFNTCDWYYVLNMTYSKHYKPGRSDEVYIELAYDSMTYKEAPKDVAKRYYKLMHH